MEGRHVLSVRSRALLAYLVSTCTVVLLGACAGPPPHSADPPPSPTDVVAASGPGYIALSWDHSGAGVAGFEIDRTDLGRLEIVGADARSFIDRNVTVGTTYEYSVNAIGPTGVSSDSAPAAGPVTLEPGVLLVPGTYGNPLFDQPGTAIALHYFLAPELLSVAGAQVTVTGPPGWNSDTPLELDAPLASLVGGFDWVGLMQAPITGSYSLTVTALGTTFTSSATLDQLGVLPVPKDITITAVSSLEVIPTLSPPVFGDRVSVSWSPVPGARSYQATVHDAPYRSDAVEFGRITTSETNGTIFGPDLPPGQLFVFVTAFTVDLTYLPPEPVAPFNVALEASAYFTVK